MNEKRKIIIDCDPGHDDAVAIMLAGNSNKLELLGITTVAGNQTIEKTSNNAFNVTRFLGINVDIYKGSTKPLYRKPITCPEIHGESGLDGYTFPKYDFKFGEMDAVEYIHSELMKHKKVTLIPTGPLTNIAKLLLKYPNDKQYIEEIVLMGGSTEKGNITPEAEFNILVDGEAADIVFSSNLNIKMVGLNVTRKALLLDTVIDCFSKINTNAAKMFTILMDTFNKNQQKFFGLVAAPLHDPLTVASLINDDVLHFENMDVKVVTDDNEKYGKTVCTLNKDSKTQVATEVNLQAFWDVIADSLSRYN